MEESCLTDQILKSITLGSLDEDSISKAQRHLDTCEQCSQRLTEIDKKNRPFSPGFLAALSEYEPDIQEQRVIEPHPGMTLNSGRYRLIKQVGKGGFGSVWSASDERLARVVAIKFPHIERIRSPKIRERFEEECKIVAKLDHSGLANVYEVGFLADGSPFAISKFIEGQNLANYIENGPVSLTFALQTVKQIAESLEYAHKKGVIHRDVKPSNVIVQHDGKVVLIDFGLAKQFETGKSLTTTGNVMGTLAYMSPEQVQASSAIDSRTDQYSLGVLFCELVSGIRPFTGKPEELLQKILNRIPNIPEKHQVTGQVIPAPIRAIMMKSLEKTPADRYASMQDFVNDLARFEQNLPIRAKRPGVRRRSLMWMKRNPGLSFTGVLIALLVSLFGYMMSASPVVPQPIEPELPLVLVRTDPPGAKVALVPVDEGTNKRLADKAIFPNGVTPLEVPLNPGLYFVEVLLSETGEFHQVYRTVPKQDIQVPARNHNSAYWTRNGPIVEVPIVSLRFAETENRLVDVNGGEFLMGDNNFPHLAPAHLVKVESFSMQEHEVTIAEYQKVIPNLPAGLNGVPVLERMNWPVTYVSYFDALDYAELSGLRLLTEEEFEFVATNGGKSAFPNPDKSDSYNTWSFGPATNLSFDTTESPAAIRGLYSNVAEWTDSCQVPYDQRIPMVEKMTELISASRVIKGGEFSVVIGQNSSSTLHAGARTRVALMRVESHPGLGFRCAKSSSPSYLTREND